MAPAKLSTLSLIILLLGLFYQALIFEGRHSLTQYLKKTRKGARKQEFASEHSNCRKENMLACCDLMHRTTYFEEEAWRLYVAWEKYSQAPTKFPKPKVKTIEPNTFVIEIQAVLVKMALTYDKRLVIRFFCADTRPLLFVADIGEVELSRELDVECPPPEWPEPVIAKSRFKDSEYERKEKYMIDESGAPDMRCVGPEDSGVTGPSKREEIIQRLKDTKRIRQPKITVLPNTHQCLDHPREAVRPNSTLYAYVTPELNFDPEPRFGADPVEHIDVVPAYKRRRGNQPNQVIVEDLSMGIYRPGDDHGGVVRGEFTTQLTQESHSEITLKQIDEMFASLDFENIMSCLALGAGAAAVLNLGSTSDPGSSSSSKGS